MGKDRAITPVAATLVDPAAPPAVAAPQRRWAAEAWALAAATRDPYVILITIYIFAPYFATRVVGDPVLGQSLVAGAAKWGGWTVALTAPLVGAVVDRLGPRKPWLAVVTIAMVVLTAALWFVRPGGAGLPIPAALFIFAALTALVSLHDLLHNALLLPAAGMAGAGRASGLALAGANFVSVFMLVAVLVAFALPGNVDWAFIPAQPLFGLDPAAGQTDRITAPLVAIVMALGAIPLFRLVPDMPRTAASFGGAVRAGAADLAALVREARGHRNALTYLGARMVYTDGLTGILVFGGLYAAGVMGWQTLEMLGYGIILSIAAVAGGLLAGALDHRLGPKRTVKLQVGGAIVFQTLLLGIGRDRLFWRPWSGATLWDGPMFTTLPEIVFLALGCGVAVSVSGAYASSRTLLTRVAPRDKMGVFFGLYALAGTATMWLGPLLVEIATSAGGNQAWGMVPIIGMLVIGLGLLFLVEGGGRDVAD